MMHNFKVGDLVEMIEEVPVFTGDYTGKRVTRLNRRTGHQAPIRAAQWTGEPHVIEAIDCGKTKRIKIGKGYFMPNRIRVWKEENRKGKFEPRERA